MSIASEKEILQEVRYANWLSQVIAFVAPQHLQVIAGRGTSKTTQIHAERMQDFCYDMPGSLQILVCNTYTNARTNIIPSLITGWQNYKGWKEGYHFVIGTRPPAHFKKCFTPLVDYKNVISVFNGCCIVVGSLEMVSGLAGNSYQALWGDEVKYDDKAKMDIIFPALRGNNSYPHSPYYLGTTFTTDLPNLTKGNYDWISEYEDKMDFEKVKASFQIGYKINLCNKEILLAHKKRDRRRMKNALAKRGRLMIDHYKVRKGLSMFITASTFTNVDVLTLDYLKNLLSTLGNEEFKQSVVSLKGTLEAGDQFYTGLGEQHFYSAENANYSESLGLKGVPDCNVLKYLQINEPLEGGLDFGRQISLILGQPHGRDYHIMKNIHTLVPESSRQLADRFIKFFKPQVCKVLKLYYDRSGNQYASNDRSWAMEIKNCIEKDTNGGKTGWRVELMSIGQRTILQSEEFLLSKMILEEKTPGLPLLRINKDQCPELKSSMEVSKILIKTDRKTSKKTIHKNKSSEKLTLHQLPMNSTNYSDALKYLMFRKEWYMISKGITSSPLPLGFD